MPAPDVDPYPDIELLLVGWLSSNPALNGARVVTRVPEEGWDLIVRVLRVDGAAQDIRVDRPVVDLDISGTDESAVIATSRAVENQVKVQLPGTSAPDGYVTYVSVVSGMHWLPDSNQNLFHRSGTYEIRCHA